MKIINQKLQPKKRRWSIPLGSASQKLYKKSPEQARAKQGIQPSKYRRLHPLGNIKLSKINLEMKTVPFGYTLFSDTGL